MPIVNSFHWLVRNSNAMYLDFDTWEEEGTDLDDNQLFNLGLDVSKINDNREYWRYEPRHDRESTDSRGRGYNRPPEWV